MAETAVRILKEHVSELLKYHSSLISGAENELRLLIIDLDLLAAYTRDAAMNPKREGPLGERETEELVYELEDAIDTGLTDAKKMNLAEGHTIAETIKDLRIRYVRAPIDAYLIKLLFSSAPPPSQEEQQTLVNPFPPTRSHRIVVGFEDEEETIIGYLTKPKDELDVISVIGMRGIGKTTLARRIYENDRIAYDFPIRIWTHLSPNSKNRDVYLNILKMFSSQDMSTASDKELIETVRACLEKEKFLLFLDGVCSLDDWKGIENILPRSNGESKVLITSCEYVGDGVVGKQGHKLRFLTPDESWKLLQLEVFGNLEDCPPELEKIGKSIAKKCGGLPMQVVVVGGILVGQLMKSDFFQKKELMKSEFFEEMELIKSDSLDLIELDWQKVFENGNLFLHNEMSILDALELSYSTLRYDLRECFLYLGVFPEDYEISVWTLTRLWIAEGFIRLEVESEESSEEIATQNLCDLVRRNLVMVDKVNPSGEIKTCRLHDVIRAFCIHKAREQNLFQQIRSKEGDFNKLQKCRRLYAYSNVDTLLSEVPKMSRLRSYLCFYKELVYLDPIYISSISDAFILLRVLDFKIIQFHVFPARITDLIHLRYLTLSVDDLHTLPPSLSDLWDLQTLVVDTKSHLITMEANIWSLIHLRHVKTNAAIVLSPKGEGEGKAGEHLQTLHTLSPESCTEEVSERALNLKTLRIRGELPTLFKNMFLENLVRLEKLKLVNDSFSGIAYQSPLHCLPQPNSFPPNLRCLTLSNTFLKWNHMSTLAKINTLQVLKLKNNAFSGIFWSLEEVGFPSLSSSCSLQMWI